MKIKVTNSEYPHSWYINRIGEVFDVIEESKTFDGKPMFIVYKGRLLNSYVSKCDCEIIEP